MHGRKYKFFSKVFKFMGCFMYGRWHIDWKVSASYPTIIVLNQFEYANVSIPIAILIWVMIYPMVMKVDFNSIKNIGKILVDLGYQLVDQAIYHVCDCFIIFLCGIQNLDSHGISERISCRCGTSRCCTLHSNGVCLEFSYQRKSCIYSSTGCHK